MYYFEKTKQLIPKAFLLLKRISYTFLLSKNGPIIRQKRNLFSIHDNAVYNFYEYIISGDFLHRLSETMLKGINCRHIT